MDNIYINNYSKNQIFSMFIGKKFIGSIRRIRKTFLEKVVFEEDLEEWGRICIKMGWKTR